MNQHLAKNYEVFSNRSRFVCDEHRFRIFDWLKGILHNVFYLEGSKNGQMGLNFAVFCCQTSDLLLANTVRRIYM